MPVVFKLITWNLKDFGDFDRSGTLDFIVEVIRKADIVLVQEVVCNRFSKRLKSGIDEARSSGIAAVDGLGKALSDGDPNAEWAWAVSRVNCTNTKRDAYAYLWKGKPSKALYKSSNDAPDTIEIVGTLDILNSDTTREFPDRRPSVLDFKINGEAIPIFNFHASVQKPYDSCRTLSEVDEIAQAPKGIIAGDFNVDFREQFGFENVYKFLNTQIGYTPCLGDLTSKDTGVRTSLAPKQPQNKYYSSAYDNVLIKGIKKRNSKAIDIIELYRIVKYSKIAEHLGLRFSMTQLYPKTGRKQRFTKRKNKVSCVSDHRPVETDMELG
jgi:endonuclease/exonuclease/phosphatase family metal-dependent hydrolase